MLYIYYIIYYFNTAHFFLTLFDYYLFPEKMTTNFKLSQKMKSDDVVCLIAEQRYFMKIL